MRHDGTGLEVQIHNISGTGLLLESDVKLATGDRIEIELPHAGDITAVVIWASGRLFGCQFEGPVSPATLSAVELKSAIGPAPELADAADPAPGIDEDQSAPVIDEAPGEPETLLDLIDRSREQIAVAAGISADRVRIIVEF
ncbi:PilZ domain-containing protein [Sphingopyxis sp. H053]|uniref:PilZ domain-containing protein n=1 Tax=Sphingopyxis sp. H053 TaxID=1759067 RepID=UPI003FA6DC0A